MNFIIIYPSKLLFASQEPSFLSIGLLIYCLIFAGIVIYKKAYGWEIVLLSIIITVIGFAFLYKKTSIERQNIKNRIIIVSCFIIYFIIFSIVGFLSKEGIKHSELYSVFLFINISKKSYIALCILSSIVLGIILSYYNCPYEAYRKTYNHIINKREYIQTELEYIINLHFYTSSILLIVIFIVIFVPLGTEAISRSDIYKIVLLIPFPIYITSSFQKYFYLTAFNKAKDY